MAINKNFVIKNGVQVNTDLIVGDSTTNKVGVGTTVPGYTLHVGATKVGSRGGIGATDLNVTGVGTFSGVKIGGPAGIITATSPSGIVPYYGDGSQLSNIITGITIQDNVSN